MIQTPPYNLIQPLDHVQIHKAQKKAATVVSDGAAYYTTDEQRDLHPLFRMYAQSVSVKNIRTR